MFDDALESEDEEGLDDNVLDVESGLFRRLSASQWTHFESGSLPIGVLCPPLEHGMIACRGFS